jgi:hypothetical protein
MVAVGLAFAFPSGMAAQDIIGHPPNASPYLDVESNQELAIFSGYYIAGKDPARVAPQSAPVIGLRESLRLGGPVVGLLRLTHVFSDRTEIDPTQPVASRVLNTIPAALTIADVGFGINLTGDRSFHQVMPSINAGVGVVSDLGAPHDIGRYRFGTSLAVTYGGGIRWVPGGRLSLRANIDSYLYQHDYPKSYRTVAIDGTSVLPATHTLIAWRANGLFTLGASYALFH